MKSIFLKIFFLSLPVGTVKAIPEKPEIKSVVTATVYNAVPEQTNSEPLITASGFVIDKDSFPNIIAVSRDLERKFPMGSKVRISGTSHDGIYRVEDRMHKRWRKKIDILVPDSIKTGKWKKVSVVLMSEG